MRRYWRGRGTVLDKGYNPARLRKSLARCEPATGGRKSRARHAAETKMAARKQVFLSQTHGSLLTVLRFSAVIAQEIAPALSLSSQLRLVAIGGIASALPPCRGAGLLVCHLLWSAVSLPLLCSGQDIVALQTSTPEVEVPYLANVRFGSEAEIATDKLNVRFAPESGHGSAGSFDLFCLSTSLSIARDGRPSPSR